MNLQRLSLYYKWIYRDSLYIINEYTETLFILYLDLQRLSLSFKSIYRDSLYIINRFTETLFIIKIFTVVLYYSD